MAGKRVCYMHGGKSRGPAKGSKNALKHGIFSSGVFPDEVEVKKIILENIDDIDENIAMLQLQIRRAYAELKRREEGNYDGIKPELSNLETVESFFEKGTNAQGDYEKKSITKKSYDVRAYLNQLHERLRKLIETRNNIQRGGDHDGNLDALLDAINRSRIIKDDCESEND